MVFVGFFRIVVHPEAFIRCIVGVFHRFPRPVFLTFDAEVVFTDLCEAALSATGFQKSLS